MVARAEELISAGATRLWDELAAESATAPTPRAFLSLDVEPGSIRPVSRAVVVFDGLSLREMPLLLSLANATGFRVNEARAIATSFPTETLDFVSQRVLGPDAAHGIGPSQLPGNGALASRGAQAFYLDSLTPRITLPAGKSLLLWSTYPDRLFKDDEARFDTQLFPQFGEHIATLWKYTVQTVPSGVPIVITSDHGYIFLAAPQKAPAILPRRLRSTSSGIGSLGRTSRFPRRIPTFSFFPPGILRCCAVASKPAPKAPLPAAFTSTAAFLSWRRLSLGSFSTIPNPVMSKIKVGTQIEEDVYQQLKMAAVREHRPVGEVIQDAVSVYLRRQRKSGLGRLLERVPFKITDEQFRVSMEADFYDQ